MSFSTELFNDHMKSVYNWNLVARNFNVDFTESDIKRQSDYVSEEAFETISAIATNDVIEVIDGICDTFVTATYKHTQVTGELEFEGTKFEVDYVKPDSDALLRLNLIAVMTQLLGRNVAPEDAKLDSLISMDVLHQLMGYVEFVYNFDINDAMTEVMDSNWSKFPLFIEDFDYAGECEWIENYYQKVDVKHAVVEINGERRVVFRDNGGAGKVCKPSVFQTPDIGKLLQ